MNTSERSELSSWMDASDDPCLRRADCDFHVRGATAGRRAESAGAEGTEWFASHRHHWPSRPPLRHPRPVELVSYSDSYSPVKENNFNSIKLKIYNFRLFKDIESNSDHLQKKKRKITNYDRGKCNNSI